MPIIGHAPRISPKTQGAHGMSLFAYIAPPLGLPKCLLAKGLSERRLGG